MTIQVWRSHTHITIGLSETEASRLQAVLETSRSEAFDLSMAELSRGLTANGIHAEWPEQDEIVLFDEHDGQVQEY